MGKNIDILKSFKRVNQIPEFDDDIYSTFKEANDYVLKGKNGESNAYPGQLIRVVPTDSSKTVNLYIVDKEYNLVSLLKDFNGQEMIPIATMYDLPSVGRSDVVYAIKDSNTGYVFKPDGTYKQIELDLILKIDEIHGGSSNG